MSILNKPSFEDDTPTTAPAATARVNNTQVNQGNKMTDTIPASTRMTTGVVRGSYCNLFTPRQPKPTDTNKTPKYGMTILIPKEDTDTLKKIEAAREAAISLKWPNKRPPKIDFTLHDGDGTRPQTGEEFGPECKGHWVMAVQSKFQPQVLDRSRSEILDPNKAVSGDYFKVALGFYAYENSGKRGVSAGLNNVLFWERGQPLGGRTNAEDDFSQDFQE